MHIQFHRNFKKQYKKLPKKFQRQFVERLSILQKNPKSQLLNVHKLHGKFYMYWSMNVNSDVRALFVDEKDTIVFQKIGTQSELY